VLIPAFLDVSALTDFAIMCQLLQLSNFFILPLVHVWYPTLPSRLRGGEDLSAGLGYVFIGAVIVNIGILIGTESIVGLWVGPGHFLGSSVLIVLVLIAILDVTQVSLRSALVALDKLNNVSRFIWGGLVGNVVLSYWLAKEYGIGGILVGPLLVEGLLVVVMNSRLKIASPGEQSAGAKILKRCWPVVGVLVLAIVITIPQFGADRGILWVLRVAIAMGALGAGYLSVGSGARCRLLGELRNVGAAIGSARLEY
jgi:O-antigen/teichoic acid export membrane protein